MLDFGFQSLSNVDGNALDDVRHDEIKQGKCNSIFGDIEVNLTSSFPTACRFRGPGGSLFHSYRQLL